MSAFLAPLALAGLSLLPVIVVLYMLKLKRRPQRVPSTLLWRRSIQDMVANAPFQRLRNNLLMWLQLLALLLLVLGLARPVGNFSGGKGETLILLLDLSASMQTVESNGQTRLDKGKELALKAVENMSGGNGLLSAFSARDEMMIIGFAEKTFPLQTLTTDKGALRTAILSAKAQDTETNIEDAGYILQERTMVNKGDTVEPNPDARVILISDGGLGPTAAALADVPQIDFVQVGETRDNIGLTRVDLRESFTGQYEQQVFVGLVNASAEEKTAYVELEAGGNVLDLKRATLPADGTGSVLFTVGEGISGPATVRLSSHRDALAMDDSLPVVIQPRSELKIQLVTRGNPFLERALAVDPRTNIEVASPDGWTLRDGYDIVIFDSYSPESLGPGNFIFVNALPPVGTGFDPSGEPIKNPRVVDWSRIHPITRFCSFENLAIARTIPFTAPKDAVLLVESVETPLIAVQETDSRRLLVVGFDILKSYWPLDVSFPIFWGNVLESWSRQGRGLGRAAWATGSTVPIVPPRDAKIAEVSTPAGQKISFALESQGTLYLTETAREGFYSVDFGVGQAQALAIGLMSELESQIAPATSLEIGGRTIKAERGAVEGRQELWPWLILAGLLIFCFEWLIYCRRTYM
ncbi:VWA domain-containing protein [bacterium]|nr:VWA domain-containing protein [bacterium]